MKTDVLRAAMLAVALALTAPASAQPRPAPGEVIDTVAQYTGMTNDAVSLALKDNAAALGRLTDAVVAVQIAQQFLDARDAEIATTVLNQATDSAAEALLPPPLLTAIKAVRLYKSMLEAVRDLVFIPKLDAGLYAAYRANRAQNQDVINAFSYATSQSLGGGYYAVKPKMVEDYISKYKGWDKDLVGEPMRRRAERQVDRFWMARLEATYQQEKVKPDKQTILAAIWASVKDITDQFKAPARIGAALFPDPGADLPGGWWWAKSAGAEYKAPAPYAASHTPMWMQTIELSTVQGYTFKPYKGGGGAWCRPERNGKCDLPYQRVEITISDWTMHGGEKPCTLSLQSMLKDFPANYQRLSDRAVSSVGQNPEQNGIRFCLKNYSVSLNNTALNGASSNPAITRHFSNVIVSKINAQSGGKATVGTE
ncbi:MAG: hypothetical protein JSR72_01880 [Proteobacteria bacterium]|nr:hypothetical protein [Pseudomonadota bacterium]